MTITDEEVEDLIKGLKEIGINGFLVTASKLEEMSDKEREEGK